MDKSLEREALGRGRGEVRRDTPETYESQERYHEYVLRRLREERVENERLFDESVHRTVDLIQRDTRGKL